MRDLDRDGAVLFERIDAGRSGARLPLEQLPAIGVVQIATRLARAVRQAGRKRAERNWVVAWHQDCTIAVATQDEVPGFGPYLDDEERPTACFAAGLAVSRNDNPSIHLD